MYIFFQLVIFGSNIVFYIIQINLTLLLIVSGSTKLLRNGYTNWNIIDPAVPHLWWLRLYYHLLQSYNVHLSCMLLHLAVLMLSSMIISMSPASHLADLIKVVFQPRCAVLFRREILFLSDWLLVNPACHVCMIVSAWSYQTIPVGVFPPPITQPIFPIVWSLSSSVWEKLGLFLQSVYQVLGLCCDPTILCIQFKTSLSVVTRSRGTDRKRDVAFFYCTIVRQVSTLKSGSYVKDPYATLRQPDTTVLYKKGPAW
jgi:hypothetical protein